MTPRARFLTLVAALIWATAAQLAAPGELHAQAPAERQDATADSGTDELEEVAELLEYLENWDGDLDRLIPFLRRTFQTPEELQAAYDVLPDELRRDIEQYVEQSSTEGGIGLFGGFDAALKDDGAAFGGLFRLSVAWGIVWPYGDFDVPIYYVFTDIPVPAVGFQLHAHTDNFSSASLTATAHWGGDYFGWSPYIDLGPTVQVGFDGDIAPGVRADVGYGNILIQGFVQTEVLFGADTVISQVYGVRIPWQLFTLL